jgi:hypothetical protein
MCHPNAEVHTEKVSKVIPEAHVLRRHIELIRLDYTSQKTQARGQYYCEPASGIPRVKDQPRPLPELAPSL